MSTELFRRYINIINEVSENEMTELTRAITDLETVLAKYKNKIRENQNNRAQTRLLQIDQSQMSRAEIEALREGGSRPPGGTRPPGGSKEAQAWHAERSAQSTGGTTPPMFGPDKPPGPSMVSRIKSGSGQLARYTAYAALAYDILSQVYDYMMKTDFKDLAPGDQEIIKKNIPIIQSWLAPDKFEILNRYGSLQTRLLHVVDLLGKLGMSLKSNAAAATPGAVPAADSQTLEKLLNKAQPFNEYYQAELKKIIAENMHLFSEAEKIAVHRDLVSEDLSDIPGYQYALGIGGLGATGGALRWAQTQANKLAAEKIAAEKAAAQASADALAAKEQNARITAQNAEAMRNYNAQIARRKLGRPRPPLPELEDLVPVPTVPSAYPPSKLTRLQRMGASMAPGTLATLAAKHPIKTAIGSGLLWMYDLIAPFAKQAIGFKTGVETIQAGLDAVSKNSPKEDYYALFKYLADNPTAYTNADPATRKALDQKQLDFCNNFPREEGCEKRKLEICQDYEKTGPDGKVTSLPGCDLG